MNGDVRWPRVIAHADMDAFYASVEQLDDPAIRGLPVIVGGTGARGVVSSASYEARRFGVRSAMPSVQARKLCPDGIFVAGRMKRYVEISRQVRRVFDSFSPLVEPLSLDEAFIDLTGCERVLGAPAAIAVSIRARVREETGLIVSVGVAPIKMVAKILSDMSKPDGWLILGPSYVREFLSAMPVERIWGVGRVMLERLHREQIHTAGDLAARDPAELARKFGSMGPHLHALASGEDAREVVGDWRRKSYGEENTFASDLELDSTELRRILIAHADAIAARLRADHVRARTITLKLKFAGALGGGRFPMITRSHSLDIPSDDGPEISAIATAMIARVRSRDRIRLAGIQAHNLEPAEASQPGLFEQAGPRVARRDRLNQALDTLSKKFGDGTVSRGLARADRAAPTTRIK
jgi:DNA polymerase-4